MLPIFVINLDRRPDRLASITTALGRIGLHFERVVAIDAKNLPLPEYACRALGVGEQACLMSHHRALERFLASDAVATLILEDDVEISPDLPRVLQSTAWWPVGRGVIKLDTSHEKPRLLGRVRGTTPTGQKVREMVLASAGCGGYLIDRAAARTLVNADDDPLLPIDRILFDLRYSRIAKRLRPVQCHPPLVRHGVTHGSDIEVSRKKAESTSVQMRPRQRLGSVRHKLAVVGLRAIGQVRRHSMEFDRG